MRTPAIVILGMLLAALIVPVTASAEELPGDPRDGYALASAVCDACHVIDPGVLEMDAGGAPSFQAVANNPTMTALALRVFFGTPHTDMPDLILTGPESDDIIAYILGLKDRR
jgi:mono/diheme cytochrome c family protein